MAIVSTTNVDKNIVRVERDDKIVGFALRMSSGMWKAFGPEMISPIAPGSFKTPKAAASAVLAAVPETDESGRWTFKTSASATCSHTGTTRSRSDTR